MSEDDLLALVREARPHLIRASTETEAYLSRLEERHDELNELVERLLHDDPAAAADACGTLWSFWWERGHLSEGRRFLERAVALDGIERAPVLKGLGTLAFRHGDLKTAERAFWERYELVDSPVDRADACADLARVALRRRNFGEVRRWADMGYEAAGGLEDPGAIRLPLHMRAAAARMEAGTTRRASCTPQHRAQRAARQHGEHRGRAPQPRPRGAEERQPRGGRPAIRSCERVDLRQRQRVLSTLCLPRRRRPCPP